MSPNSDINASARKVRARLSRLFRRRERCAACGRRIRPQDHVVHDVDEHGVSGTYHQVCALDLHVPGEVGHHDRPGRGATFGRKLVRRRRQS